jgi:DNA-binding NarL/FixJ family response regulator
MNIKILIADQLPIIRSGIKNELNKHTDFEIVGEATEGNETYFLINSLKPDVVLLDISMPGMKVVDIIRETRKRKLNFKVIIITSLCDEQNITELLQIGIDGYLLKDEKICVISDAIYKICNGNTYFSQNVLSIIVEKACQYDSNSKWKLTAREINVLDLMCSGKTNKEIAKDINTSKRTVEFHVSNILRKLGVRNRIEAIIIITQCDPKNRFTRK